MDCWRVLRQNERKGNEKEVYPSRSTHRYPLAPGIAAMTLLFCLLGCAGVDSEESNPDISEKFGIARVNYKKDAVDSQRRFGDVSSDDDLAPPIGRGLKDLRL